MLLSYKDLIGLIETGVLENADKDSVNSASIDVTLGNNFQIESDGYVASYSSRQQLNILNHYLADGERLLLHPGQFCLAQTKEIFHLPNWLSAEYKLKSSMARMGLEHLNAGWCDAGWNGSVLTLELKNMTQQHIISISPGDKIGQMVFFKHAPVPTDKSYASRGRYNNDKKVSGIKE